MKKLELTEVSIEGIKGYRRRELEAWDGWLKRQALGGETDPERKQHLFSFLPFHHPMASKTILRRDRCLNLS